MATETTTTARAQDAHAARVLNAQPTDALLALWDRTDTDLWAARVAESCGDGHLAAQLRDRASNERGWVLVALEERDPSAFSAWLTSGDESPRGAFGADR